MKILVLGSTGMVGSSVVRAFRSKEHKTSAKILAPSRKELNLVDFNATLEYFMREKPDVTIVAAAKVGGIKANMEQKADFIRDNLAIAYNCIEAAHRSGCNRLVFLGSSCVYPKNLERPITEDMLMSAPLEPTNDAYAVAKIAGVYMCKSYRQQYGREYFTLMPCNLYGPGDNYDLNSSHVLPAMIRKFHEAKISKAGQVVLWGDGSPLREFLYVDDLAEIIVITALNGCGHDILNVGAGVDLSIKKLAQTVRDIVYPECEIVFNGNENLNGTHKKLMDNSKAKEFDWSPTTDLPTGIRLAYLDYLDKHKTVADKILEQSDAALTQSQKDQLANKAQYIVDKMIQVVKDRLEQ